MKRIGDIIAKHPKKILAGGAAAALGAGYLKNERHHKRMKTDPAYRKADQRMRAKRARESEAQDRKIAGLKASSHESTQPFGKRRRGAYLSNKPTPGSSDTSGDWYDESDIRTARKRVRNAKLPKAQRKAHHYSALGELFEFGAQRKDRKPRAWKTNPNTGRKYATIGTFGKDYKVIHQDGKPAGKR